MFQEDRLEKTLRKALRIKHPLPEISSYDFVPIDGKKSFVMEKVSQTEKQKRTQAWHEAPRRAHLLQEGLRKTRVYKTKAAGYVHNFSDNSLALHQKLFPSWMGDKIDARLVEGLLKNARTLKFKSYHVHDIGHTFDVEGYFVFKHRGKEYSEPLTVYSRAAFEKYMETQFRVQDSRHDFPIGHSPFFGNYIIADCRSLDNQILTQAIQTWYTKRFYFVPGHWTRSGVFKPHVDLTEVAWDHIDYGA